ncbi:MAG: DUF1858 domain-containing protein [Gemmataceae bacterium]
MLRVVAQTLTDFTPNAFPVAGVSGVLEVTGLAFWGVHLWAVMGGYARLRNAAPAGENPQPYRAGEPVAAGHRVGEVLDARPELLERLIALGFRPLANPLLRRTVARRVTLGEACGQLGLDPGEVLAALNRPGEGPAAPAPAPGHGSCDCCRH